MTVARAEASRRLAAARSFRPPMRHATAVAISRRVQKLIVNHGMHHSVHSLPFGSTDQDTARRFTSAGVKAWLGGHSSPP